MSENDPEQPDSATPPPNRRANSGRVGEWLGNWARDTFSREQLASSFKSFLWVAPLTILIWVYAEREQPNKGENQVIIFNVKANDPRIIVKMIDPPERSLIAELRGTRASVDAVKDLLTPKGDQAPVTINISTDIYKPGGGPYTVRSEILSDQDIFRNNNVTVTNINPPQLKFNVDQLVTMDVDVQTPPLTNFPNLAGAPVIEPRRVQVTGPSATLQSQKDRGELRVTADFSNYSELNTPGKHELSVPLTLSFKDPDVTISPSTVKVSIEVQQLRKEYRKESIPIFVTYPPGLDREYRAKYEESLRFITFLGPPAVIAQMEQNNPKMQPKARFEVVRPDAASPVGTDQTAEIKYDLPEGVTVSPADAKKTITYTMEQKPE